MSQDSVIPPGPAAPRRSSTTGVVVPILVILYALALGLSVALVVTGRHEAVGITGVLAVLTLAPVAFVTALSSSSRVAHARADSARNDAWAAPRPCRSSPLRSMARVSVGVNLAPSVGVVYTAAGATGSYP